MILVYRVKRTGQWCAPSVTSDAFHMTQEEMDARAARVAVKLGLEEGSLEPVVSKDDPRSGELIAEYVAPPPPAPKPEPDPELDAIVAILNKADADVTAGELKALVLRTLRRFYSRGRI